MQVLLDSLRGAIGFMLIFTAIIAIMYFVLIIDIPSREQFDAHYAARNRQMTIMWGGMLMLITICGIGVFAYNLWRS